MTTFSEFFLLRFVFELFIFQRICFYRKISHLDVYAGFSKAAESYERAQMRCYG